LVEGVIAECDVLGEDVIKVNGQAGAVGEGIRTYFRQRRGQADGSEITVVV
jgi:hypothetical protein